jgi:hypothetical protein
MLSNFHRMFSSVFTFALFAVLMGCTGGGISEPGMSADEIAGLPAPQQAIMHATDGNLSSLQALVDANPDMVRMWDDQGRTLLHYAAANGHRNVVDYLLDKGANPAAEDEDGFTPADAAGSFGHTSISRRIRDAMAQ